MERTVHLVLLGAHTRVLASLCASCPSGPAGCCAAPPGLSWSDIGRIASLGGAGWIAEEMARGHLRRGPRGLVIHRVEVEPAYRKCVYHGPEGCTIAHDRRSAACNYYVCSEALDGAEGDVVVAEAACSAWMAQYAGWDETLSLEIGGWEGRVDSLEEDLRLFERLGRRFEELSGEGKGYGRP